jgi:hypothetical protein
MFRVITSLELNRALMVSLLHPLSRIARMYRMKHVLSTSSHEDPPLIARMLHLGLSHVQKQLSPVTSRLSVSNSNHPQLVKKKEQQILEIATKLRSTSVTSNSSFAFIAEGEVGNHNSTTHSFDSVGSSTHLHDYLESLVDETNKFRVGFQSAFMNSDTPNLNTECKEKELIQSFETKGSSENVRLSLLSCFLLQRICLSLVSLTERSRYGDDDAINNEKLTETQNHMSSSAFHINSHLFQTMLLWPAVSEGLELFPPADRFWIDSYLNEKSSASLEDDTRSNNLSKEETSKGPVGEAMLEFEEDDIPVDIEDETKPESHGIVGIKLNMSENLQQVSSNANSNSLLKPSDFDVSMELVYAADEVYANPFSTEPAVSLIANRKLLDSQEGNQQAKEIQSLEKPTVKNNIRSLTVTLQNVNWIDSDIVPVPMLAALYEQQSEERHRWLIPSLSSDIPTMLGTLMTTKRAHSSLVVMQVF